MVALKELFQDGDWNKEKHVPEIKLLLAKKGKPISVQVEVGSKIPHPNFSEHHIRWIALYFLPEGEKFPYELARVEFSAHGESINGRETSTIYAVPAINVVFKTEKEGSLLASSYCNIHGLWENSLKLKLE